ncbi:nuclear transport factor 2 family protein [Nocardia sp. NPDC088792]|jgi:3-phenylpropionate/cinnamic acid dioxygenase small subunit|uniref:nuclear transport factor 2 family protein n=1 Tax=Nocardia sp. NPDC088792 TaxID=3364332 RepID=UPI003822C497
MSAATDTTAVMNLIARYAELVDDGDFAGVGAMFADGVFGGSGGGSVRGAAGIEKMLRGMVILYEDGTPRTHHVTTNIVVNVDAERKTAVGRSYFTVFQAVSDFPLQAVAAGRYDDRFERCDGEWRFAERRVDIRLTGDTSRHLRVRPPAAE